MIPIETNNSSSKLVISIVSHGNSELIRLLLDDLNKVIYKSSLDILIYVTLNIHEQFHHDKNWKIPMQVKENSSPLGYGENHNRAFKATDSNFFVVLNPDIRIPSSFNFDDLLLSLHNQYDAVSPLIFSPEMHVEDHFRDFPTLKNLILRYLSKFYKKDYQNFFYQNRQTTIEVDWIAGMFMVFRSDVFSKVNGFDTKFFMYLEDADICRRISNLDGKVGVISSQHAIHDARRKSLKNLKHFSWHFKSMIIFLLDS